MSLTCFPDVIGVTCGIRTCTAEVLASQKPNMLLTELSERRLMQEVEDFYPRLTYMSM